MYIFVSDVHLKEPQSKRYGAFLNLLDEISESSEIKEFFMVGDIFDLWLGDREVFKSKHAEALKKIKLIAKKKKVHYFEGNHDFQLGEFWRELGVKTYQDYAEFNLKGQKVLVGHGDLLDEEDVAYLRLRRFFRTPFARFLIRFLPSFLLYKIGDALSTTERKKPPTDSQKNAFQQKWKRWTRHLHKKKKFDVFICGHFHFDADFIDEKTGARSVNLGTWLDGDYRVFEL